GRQRQLRAGQRARRCQHSARHRFWPLAPAAGGASDHRLHQHSADPTKTVMPSDHTHGDIPKIAIATGSVDQVECILRKMGIKDSEFTDPSGSGRINLYGGGTASGSGSVISSQTPPQASLMGGTGSTLNQY